MKKTILLIILIIYSSINLIAQTSSISGTVSSTGDEPIISATVQLVGTKQGTYTNNKGIFKLNEVPIGSQSLKFSSIGYKDTVITLEVKNGINEVKIQLQEGNINFDEIVVTGTRTAKRRTDSPVIVNLINSKELDHVVAINLSEGLKYQPGLRVETDCQTCNYTQLRMNGLQGGYSQILVNSRPIFSPLTGLYGLEQIPVNMIERIEVVRGGVSALYGSSAIGGTVNVITKIPSENTYNVTNTLQSIRGSVMDNILSANATVLNDNETAGATFFVSNRTRGAYDANGDNFSELPELNDNSFGTNLFYQITNEQKLSLSLSSIHEYRYGGEMVEGPAYLSEQSEERTHNVFMGSLDYQLDFNNYKNTLAIYYGGQKTDRDHYTGIKPDSGSSLNEFLSKPPYGISDVITHQFGFQLNNRLDDFIYGNAILSIGAEYIYDDVYDEIESYNYKIDQTTKDIGAFLQYDWSIVPEFNLLTGVRLDKHNLVENAIFSPRVSLLYKWQGTTQFRLGWGTGFRAPQAFDTDLHIAFAGGGVSRISLADNLKEERSNSYTASVNYDKATEHFIAGFTLEGFYTTLNDAFYQFPLGEDDFGQRFEKRNGSGATVKGITIETRANFDYIIELEAGFTIQSSLFEDAIVNVEGLPAKHEFLRTPNDYGYATLTYNPSKLWNISANMTYTGTMELAHFGGDNTGQLADEYFTSPSFFDLGLRVGHTLELSDIDTGLELFGGIKNIFDAYQNDFDISKNRDSNYIYGPSLPRTMFVGIRVKPR
ncbi:MAG: TonB-dependent receptor [Candidatus Kapaibacterium sp.]